MSVRRIPIGQRYRKVSQNPDAPFAPLFYSWGRRSGIGVNTFTDQVFSVVGREPRRASAGTRSQAAMAAAKRKPRRATPLELRTRKTPCSSTSGTGSFEKPCAGVGHGISRMPRGGRAELARGVHLTY